jgi:hypothetical protein
MNSSVAGSFDDLARSGGITAVFQAGATALSHHWQLYDRDGSTLARTARVHNGGKAAQVFWKALSVTGLDANNDIHVELLGAEERPLARASSTYSNETVAVVDPAGQQVARSKRDKKTLVVCGSDDSALFEMVCDGDGPWPVRDSAGTVIGELLAGEPGPSLSPALWQWVDPQFALNTATYARTMHLGLRRVKQYSFAPSVHPLPPALALLPLLCGLSY